MQEQCRSCEMQGSAQNARGIATKVKLFGHAPGPGQVSTDSHDFVQGRLLGFQQRRCILTGPAQEAFCPAYFRMGPVFQKALHYGKLGGALPVSPSLETWVIHLHPFLYLLLGIERRRQLVFLR